MNSKKTFIVTASASCFIACIGDLWITYILGAFKPGYSQVRNTMSSLGVGTSLVSVLISIWWVLLGVLIILFAIGFAKAFNYRKRAVKIATWLIILYGLGEGLGSGLFKDEQVNNTLTLAGNIHEIVGGIGTTAILVLPLAMNKIILKTVRPWFHTLSILVLIAGIVFLFLFLLRIIPHETNDLFLYKGLWQRLFILNYYIYLMVISVIMIKKQPIQFK